VRKNKLHLSAVGGAQRLVTVGILFFSCAYQYVIVSTCDHIPNICEHDIVQTTCMNFTILTIWVQLGQRWTRLPGTFWDQKKRSRSQDNMVKITQSE